MTPHDFQSEILADVRAGWQSVRKQLVVSPTGSGKTCMFSWMSAEFLPARTLILVDQDELVWQTVEKLKAVTGLTGTVEKAELVADRSQPIVVSTVQTMARRLDEWPANYFGLVIADEGDKSISAQWQTVLRHFDPYAKVCAFTATPHRTDKKNLGCYYERCVEHENLLSLIRKGFLSRVKILQLPIKIDLSSVRVTNGDLDAADIHETLLPHLGKIAEAIKEHAAFRKTIVFVPLVRTAVAMADICRQAGLRAKNIDGKDPCRDSKLQDFKDWKFDVLINSMLLTRGVDVPSVDCIIPCRPTQSITLYQQMVGRGTRLAPGKSDVLLMDCLYESEHLVCRPAHLVATDDLEVKQISEAASCPPDDQMPLDLEMLQADAASKREIALRRRLDEVSDRDEVLITPEELGLLHPQVTSQGDRDIGPVTDKQKEWLRKIKVHPRTGAVFLRSAPPIAKPLAVDQIKTVGAASKILDMAFDKKNQGICWASGKQWGLMRRMGYSGDRPTADEARRWFGKRKKESVLI